MYFELNWCVRAPWWTLWRWRQDRIALGCTEHAPATQLRCRPRSQRGMEGQSDALNTPLLVEAGHLSGMEHPRTTVLWMGYQAPGYRRSRKLDEHYANSRENAGLQMQMRPQQFFQRKLWSPCSTLPSVSAPVVPSRFRPRLRSDAFACGSQFHRIERQLLHGRIAHPKI